MTTRRARQSRKACRSASCLIGKVKARPRACLVVCGPLLLGLIAAGGSSRGGVAGGCAAALAAGDYPDHRSDGCRADADDHVARTPALVRHLRTFGGGLVNAV